MSNVKISALPSATTPLAGTEQVPIVQSGATVKVAVSDLTAGRSIEASQVDITAQGDLRLQDSTGGEYVGFQAPATLGASYILTMPTTDGNSGEALVTDGSGVLSWSFAASGDVYGPASSTDNALARFDSTTGKIIQNSVGILSDAGALSGLTGLSSTSGTFSTTLGVTGVATFTAQPILSSLTASSAVATDASKGLVSVTNTGTGNNVLATSPTLVTPILGTPTSATLTNATGLPLTTGVTGTLPVGNGGTGATTLTLNGVVYGNGTSAAGITAAGTTGQVLIATTSGAPSWGSVPSTAAVTSITFGTTGLTPATATTGAVTVAGTLAVANGGTGVVTSTGTGSVVLSTSPTLVTPALGTPSSGIVTNLTGTASININGTVGATTASTGSFTTLSATGVATFSAGTVSLPAITTTGDTNTGIYFPAADTIAFTEGGAESMRITSAGLVGIGTSSPGSKLTVASGGIGLSKTYSLLWADSNTEIRVDDAPAWLAINNTMTFKTYAGAFVFQNSADASSVMTVRVDTARVGIGTSSPDALLSVNGIASFGDGAAATPSIANFGDLNTGFWFPAADTIAASTGGVEALRLRSDGKLLIGYTADQGAGLLQVNGTGRISSFDFGNNGAADISWVAGGVFTIGTFFGGATAFKTSNTERMRISDTGTVLIGKTSTTSNGGDLQISSGITFPATQVAKSDANTLDDYEEGTWTPNQGAGLTVVGTFSSSGTYTKVGRVVTITGFVAGSTSVAVTASGVITSNPPFNTATEYTGISVNNAINASAGNIIGTNFLYSASAIAATPKIFFSVTYTV